MANVKITDLPTKTSVANSDWIVVDDGTTTYKAKKSKVGGTEYQSGGGIDITNNVISSFLNMELLWENPSPDTAFNNQTIALDLADYQLVLGVFKHWWNNSTQVINIFVVGGGGVLVQAPNESASASGRRIVSVSSSGITLSNASDTSGAIPLAFYGIK